MKSRGPLCDLILGIMSSASGPVLRDFGKAGRCKSRKVWSWFKNSSFFNTVPCIHAQLKEILPSLAVLTCLLSLHHRLILQSL